MRLYFHVLLIYIRITRIAWFIAASMSNFSTLTKLEFYFYKKFVFIVLSYSCFS